MGVEVRQTLERDYDIAMSMREIRQITINKLRELANSKPGGSNGFIKKEKNKTTLRDAVKEISLNPVSLQDAAF